MHRKLNIKTKILLSISIVLVACFFVFTIVTIKARGNENSPEESSKSSSFTISNILTQSNISESTIAISTINPTEETVKETLQQTKETKKTKGDKKIETKEKVQEKEKEREAKENNEISIEIENNTTKNEKSTTKPDVKLNFKTLEINKDAVFTIRLIGGKSTGFYSFDDTIVSKLYESENEASFVGIRKGFTYVYTTYEGEILKCKITIK